MSALDAWDLVLTLYTLACLALVAALVWSGRK